MQAELVVIKIIGRSMKQETEMILYTDRIRNNVLPRAHALLLNFRIPWTRTEGFDFYDTYTDRISTAVGVPQDINCIQHEKLEVNTKRGRGKKSR